MARGYEVLQMLAPNSVWTISGDDWSGIEFEGNPPITKKEFEAGFAQFDAWKLEQESAKNLEKSALLAKLGITEDEAKLLLS